ncbi:MAG: serine/threonine protein kinase [Myxococcales bacterium]|nr:serine/threonine protein kinase [Myxococcales bacterium]
MSWNVDGRGGLPTSCAVEAIGQLSVDLVERRLHRIHRRLERRPELLDVLIAAHDKGVVHRDLKPENVFLTRDGQIKVLDFGIARLRELSTASNATRDGTSMGTPSYMPPEQARGLWAEVDARSDLWAVGALMFALLTGRAVHEGRTTNELLLSAMTGPAPPLAELEPKLHAAVAAVVDRAVAFEKPRRWPDARAMQNAVRHAYQEMHRAPLSTAPKLTVAPSVADRTLPSTDLVQLSPGLSSDVTALPVARGRTGVSIVRTVLDRPVLAALGAVAVGLVVVIIAGAGVMLARRAASKGASASAVGASDVESVPSPSATPVAGYVVGARWLGVVE